MREPVAYTVGCAILLRDRPFRDAALTPTIALAAAVARLRSTVPAAATPRPTTATAASAWHPVIGAAGLGVLPDRLPGSPAIITAARVKLGFAGAGDHVRVSLERVVPIFCACAVDTQQRGVRGVVDGVIREDERSTHRWRRVGVYHAVARGSNETTGKGVACDGDIPPVVHLIGSSGRVGDVVLYESRADVAHV